MIEISPDVQTFPACALPSPSKNSRRDQIEQIIYRNQDIADISLLREAMLRHIKQTYGMSFPLPMTLQIQNRNEHLRPFTPFFRRVLDGNSMHPRIRSLVRNMQLAAQLGWKAQDFRPIPPVFDRRFSDPNDLIEPIFSAIFQDRDAGLLRQWMQAIDTHVETSSSRLIEAIDNAERRRQSPIRKDIVLVGGGPLTSMAASVLGAFFHVTVITEQNGLGKPWRNRPIYINSSSLVKDFNGAPLPLLSGGTTRIIGRQQLNSLGVDLLLGTDTKSVLCDNGQVIEYIAGPRMGDLVATNILFHADDYLINQRVDLSQTQRTTNGSIRLVLIDTEDGTRRELDAAAVFLLTGPGKEQPQVSNASSHLYQETARQLDLDLRQARCNVEWHRDALRQLEGQPPKPGVLVQREWLRKRVAQATVELPHLLTLTAIEKVYAFWEDLGADPASFPFTDLIARSKSIAYIGNGDTMRTLKEFVEGRGPMSSYPVGVKHRPGRSTIYNELAFSPQEYDASSRRRYKGTFTPMTTSVPFKARRYRLMSGESQVEVTHQDENGAQRKRQYSYAFDCTGLDRSPIEATLPASFPLHDIRDLQGNVVARGNADANLFIVGSATGWNIRDFPIKAQNIVGALGIAENTISLWINGPLVERLTYTYAATRPHTKWLTKQERGR
ncbi:MAG TPA: hypothetical protein VKR06_25105 [Ktedonosporobacter sp.]|nr:hypothetical protein [Ktedonosporobacter sp.]